MINFLQPSNGSWRGGGLSTFWLYILLRHWKVVLLARTMAHDPALVASKMALLNRYAKGTLYPVSWAVYSLKSLLTRYFYMHYPTDVEWQTQTLKCRSCGGTGKHYSYYWESGELRDVEWCWHCDGGGIYKTVEIVAFTFHVGDKTFAWHTPRDLVNFDVYEPLMKGKYKGEKAAEQAPNGDNDDFLLAYLIVNEFLWREGTNKSRYTLAWAVRRDIQHLRYALSYWFRHLRSEFAYWLIGDRPYWDNSIPF